MRHTTTTTAATAVLLLALTACGSSSSDDDGKPAAASTGSSPSPSADPAVEYLAASQDLAFTSHRPVDQELTAFPPKWCAGLDQGHSAAWLFTVSGGQLYPSGQDWGMVKTDAVQLLVAGVKAYCPQHLDTVTKELRETGEY